MAVGPVAVGAGAPPGAHDTEFARVLKRLAAGGCAGAIARTSLAPLERIKVVLQTQALAAKPDNRLYRGFSDALVRIPQEQGGIRSLWRGNGINVARIIPVSAIRFTTFFYIKESMASYSGTSADSLNAAQLFAAGGLAGGITLALTYPLDWARVRLTADTSAERNYKGFVDCLQKTLRSEGPWGMYRGLSISLFEIMPYQAINFGVYDLLKTRFANPTSGGGERRGAQGEFLEWVKKWGLGAIAGMCASLTAYPIDTVRKRIILNGSLGFDTRYTGALHCAKGILRQEGVRGFYRGCSINVMKGAPDAAITFVMFDLLSSLMQGL